MVCTLAGSERGVTVGGVGPIEVIARLFEPVATDDVVCPLARHPKHLNEKRNETVCL